MAAPTPAERIVEPRASWTACACATRAPRNGQVLLVHHPSRTVVVKLSTFPGAGDSTLMGLQDAAMVAVCEALGGNDPQNSVATASRTT